MFKIFLYIVLAGNAVAAILYPWIGVVAGYIFAILGPQFIWFWAFDGVRPFLSVALPTLIGFSFATLGGRVEFKCLKNPINISMALLWLIILVAYWFGPYVRVYSDYRWFEPSVVLGNLNSIFIFYFAAVLLLDNLNKLKWACLPILLATFYLTYWANDMYLSGHVFGRLGGPSSMYGSLYSDENTFAMLFVTGLPFVYYLGLYLQRRISRLLVWLVIPFGWHAIFLTGSRGGLLGLAVIVLITALRSPNKAVSLLIIPALIVAFQWQGGDVMKNRADTIGEYQQESSAQTRFQAWEAGLSMAAAHPFTGVGVASFGAAFPKFSEHHPRSAHNTFIQIVAEWGIIGGGAYFLIILLAFRTLLRTRRIAAELKPNGNNAPMLPLLNEALLTSFAGYLVCSLFLSLEGYVVFYYLVLLIVCISRVAHNIQQRTSEPKATSSLSMPPLLHRS